MEETHLKRFAHRGRERPDVVAVEIVVDSELELICARRNRESGRIVGDGRLTDDNPVVGKRPNK